MALEVQALVPQALVPQALVAPVEALLEVLAVLHRQVRHERHHHILGVELCFLPCCPEQVGSLGGI